MIETHDVKGFTVALDRHYDAERHLWVQATGDGRARVGMDPLGVETAGDLVQLALEPPGLALARGQAFGSMEAAKFVGPLEMPVSGVVVEVNAAAAADPGLVQRDPLGAGWLVVVELADDAELDGLLAGADAVLPWFSERVAAYRLKGMIAE